ncbi:long-chain-fatty-acid--CoA ligase [Hydrogenophaga sp.]|uniref:long-chain-fatty-acid--CoA ligase n=1 Tax=Hydrogenophaga sp. TaxID=1904254 RepID=UPI0035B49EA7
MSTSPLPSPFWPKGLSTRLHLPQTTLVSNLEIAARRYPDKPAYVVYGHRATFGRIWRNAQALAGWLQQRAGVRPGDRVLLSGQSSPQFATAYHAIQRADAAAVPVNPMNLSEEFAHAAQDSGARVVIAAQELWPRLAPLVGREIDHVVLFAYSEGLDGLDADTPDWFVAPPEPSPHAAVTRWTEALAEGLVPAPATAGPDDLALIAFTSGTTARPKGCTHSHRSLMAAALTPAIWRSETAEDTFLGASPMFHMQGLQALVNTVTYLGSTVVLLPRWDAARAAALIAEHRVSRWGVAPPMLLDLLALPGLKPDALDSVAVITGGGSALPEAVNERLTRELGIRYMEAYGMTETASMLMANPLQRTKRQCLGIPTFGVSAMVVDPVTLEPYPEGATPDSGELWVAGEQVTPGYWNNDKANAETFVQRDGKRWLRTGDLVTRDEDGYHFLVDRLKRMINVGGYKVWPTEVESLLHRHPGVQEVCVIAIPHPTRGEQVRAVVVRRPGADLTAEALMEWAKGQMATYKCPREVEFVDRLPRSGTGKIDWRSLQEAARAAAAR